MFHSAYFFAKQASATFCGDTVSAITLKSFSGLHVCTNVIPLNIERDLARESLSISAFSLKIADTF